MNSDSDSGDDINLEQLNNDNDNLTKYYQLQHKSDDKFMFKFMGTYNDEPRISLGNFNAEEKSFYLESNFVCDKKELTNQYPLMSVYVNDNGRLIRVQTGIEIKEKIETINVDTEYTGTAYIELIDNEKNYREIIKCNLIFPGSTKIVYFLLRELSNEKIVNYINGKTD